MNLHAPPSAVSTGAPNGSDKLADKLYEKILEWIVHGAVPEGGKLPSETSLAKKFEVSRPVVREALSRLQADGIIITKHGSGSYVHRHPQKEFFDFAPIGGIADLMRCFEYRIALEGEAAALAATRRTSSDLLALKRALEDLDSIMAQGKPGTEADIRFHNAIASASKNYLFESTMAALADYTAAGINIGLNLTLRADASRLRLVQQEHAAILKAIDEQDSEAARQAMRTHISNARIRILSDSVEP